MEPVKFSDVSEKILTLRNEKVILDSDVAALYGVETREINQAVKNNPDKFPEGYVISLERNEFSEIRSKFLILNEPHGRGQHAKYLPKAFTEKGLYMLATILKSPQATQTTLAIIETFAQIRELARTVAELSQTPEQFRQKSLMQKGGEIISDLLGSDLKTDDTETSIELNFAVLKFKHTIKHKGKS